MYKMFCPCLKQWLTYEMYVHLAITIGLIPVIGQCYLTDWPVYQFKNGTLFELTYTE